MRAAAAAFVGALLVLAPGATFAQAPKCQLVRLAEWPVRFERNLPTVEGTIDGKKIGVLIDTGAFASILLKPSAQRLGLGTQSTEQSMIGVGGTSQIHWTRLSELRIRELFKEGIRVRVGGEQAIRGVDLILGDDFLRNFDLEFDYARGVVRLFQPKDCGDTHLAYWDPAATTVPLEGDDKIVVPIKMNGREGSALVDSGASRSVVELEFAEKIGVTPQSPGVAPSSCTAGVGAKLVRQWVARFDTLAIGEELIRGARLDMADLMPEASRRRKPSLVLGTDFLRSHRVLVSRSQRKAYFSYGGGQVFPTTPGLECDDRAKDPQQARADLDGAITMDPANVQALLRRALQRLSDKDDAGALADLDEVIRLDPANGIAYRTRMNVRARAKNYAGALEDSDAAIANGMGVAETHRFRAQLLLAMGEPDRALKELDETVRLDPRSEPTLRARGRFHFHAGRFEAAERDFAAVLELRPRPYDPLWYAMARERRGLDGNSALEAGLAKLPGGEWPAPVLSHFLGRIDASALMAAAAAGDEKKRRGQECEARFYQAERLIARGDAGEARKLLEQARAECPREYIEYASALQELAALK